MQKFKNAERQRVLFFAFGLERISRSIHQIIMLWLTLPLLLQKLLSINVFSASARACAFQHKEWV